MGVDPLGARFHALTIAWVAIDHTRDMKDETLLAFDN